MNQKQALETAKALLKAAKENPEQFQDLGKASAAPMPKPSAAPAPAAPKPAAAPAPKMAAPKAAPMMKDDKPHPAGSPPAEAHNVAEGDESLHHAMKILDSPEKQKSMLAHLKTLHEKSDLRSPHNREAGGMPPKAPAPAAPAMEKAEVLKQAKDLLKAAKEDPKAFETLTKMSSVAGLATAEKPMDKTFDGGLALAEKQAPGSAAQPAEPEKKCGMRMSKEEIQADMKKEWKPRHMKGC